MTADDPTSHSRTPLQSGEQNADAKRRRAEFRGESAGEIRFSPNFSVYVLPPDGVCLYSENRKVFLRGELYCAVASRIGEGAHPEAIVEALSGEFPADKIDEAITRLLDRGFAVAASPDRRYGSGLLGQPGSQPTKPPRKTSRTPACRLNQWERPARGAGRRFAQIRRSGRRSLRASDGRSGGRLSRRPTCRIQPSAAGATAGLAAGATLGYFSADRSDFQAGARALAGPALPIA